MLTFILAAAFLVQVQPPKPEPITPQNIEVGQIGTIENLTVDKVLGIPNDRGLGQLVARSGRLGFFVDGYMVKGLARGKVLPKSQLWKVTDTVKLDGEDLYFIVPTKVPKK